MILAQRGYQANSKTITVSDELLVETLALAYYLKGAEAHADKAARSLRAQRARKSRSQASLILPEQYSQRP